MVETHPRQTYIGQSIIRKEDARFLTGRAAFADDVTLPGMLHAAFLRSPHAHARITGIDASGALAMPGVAGVFTFADFAEQAKPIPVRLYQVAGLEPVPAISLGVRQGALRGRAGGDGGGRKPVLGRGRGGGYRGYLRNFCLPWFDIEESLRDEVVLHEGAGTNRSAHFTVSTGDVEEAFRVALTIPGRSGSRLTGTPATPWRPAAWWRGTTPKRAI